MFHFTRGLTSRQNITGRRDADGPQAHFQYPSLLFIISYIFFSFLKQQEKKTNKPAVLCTPPPPKFAKIPVSIVKTPTTTSCFRFIRPLSGLVGSVLLFFKIITKPSYFLLPSAIVPSRMDTPGPEEMAGTGNESVAQLATKMTLVPARVCVFMNMRIEIDDEDIFRFVFL